MANKFDLFPASAFPLGQQELDRALMLTGTGLADAPTPFVTCEDIVLAKLNWYRSGGEVSDVQWRDIQGLLQRVAEMDLVYMEQNAHQLGLHHLLIRALREQASRA